jgi:hypothetical protein
MIRFRIPGLDIREPIRRRPISGAVLGALTGLGFGWLTHGEAFATSWRLQAAGFVFGGLASGLIIGSLLPSFRRRWKAAIIVAAAMGIGLLIAMPFWDKPFDRMLAMFLGLSSGIVYGALLWDYQPQPTNGPENPDGRGLD